MIIQLDSLLCSDFIVLLTLIFEVFKKNWAYVTNKDNKTMHSEASLPATPVTSYSQSADNWGTAVSGSRDPTMRALLHQHQQIYTTALCDESLRTELGLNRSDIINLVPFFSEHVGQTLSERNVVKTG